MSFLKQDNNYSHEPLTTGNAKSRSSANMPHGYDTTNCFVHIRPVVKPIATSEYIHEEHQNQKNIIASLVNEGTDIFQQKQVIKKQFGQERQYKQREQFKSNVSVESLIDALENNNLVLRCTFIREGFNSHNTCMMCTTDDLKEALNKEPTEHALKTIKIELNHDDNELCSKTGTMLMTVQADQKTGQHTLYSLDYSIINQHDDKLFSEY
tara:strand:- start:545 stop:1174 length:630 start_codon:yes stop_codon:yes gene_type:complete